MPRLPTRLAALACAALLLAAAPHAAARPQSSVPDGDVQRSPFTGIAYRDDRARVLVGERWYELDAIAGQDWTLHWNDLQSLAQEAWNERWRLRIAMDLDALLALAGRRAGDTLTIIGRPTDGLDGPASPDPVELTNLPHTTANRVAARLSFVENDHRDRLARLRALRLNSRDVLAPVAAAIRDRHAQGTRLGIDWDAALADELARAGDTAPAADLILAAQRLVARTGDGHARVREFEDVLPLQRLPFRLVHTGGSWRGLHAHDNSWVWPAGAADVRIDGVPVEAWIDAARPYVAAGADHLVRRRAASLARRAAFIRALLGVAKDPAAPVEITWTPPPDAPQDAPRSATLPLGSYTLDEPDLPLPHPVAADRRTALGFGWINRPGGGRTACIRIARMEDGQRFRDALHRMMRTALDADSLLIDVRGNTGGSRDALLVVLPYLMDRDALVFNVARPRTAMFPIRVQANGPGALLEDRFLWPADWPGWSDVERAAAQATLRDLRPSWAPAPSAGFGPWYVGIVSRERHGPRDKAILQHLPFRGPVAVLLDDRCFSATDIFLGAIELLPNVTLVGTPSGGGSARTESIEAGGLTLVLASIASFRPDGRAYDGAGIEPDILAEPAPEDYQGKGDAVLDAALRHLDQSLTPR